MKKNLLSLVTLLALIFNFSFAQKENTNSLLLPQYASYCGFIENKGQIIDQNNELNPNCLFLYNGNGLKIQLRKDGFSYEVFNTETFAIEENDDESFFGKDLHQNDCTIINSHRVDIFFENMNDNVLFEKENKSTDYVNYYTTGTTEQGISHVYHYGMVRYKNVYPNIDFEFEITKEGKAEYYWIVRPQGKVEDIKLRYEGANTTKLEEGKIVMETAHGNLEERIPASYYLDNKNELVDVSYNQSSNSSIFNYAVSSYNRSRTLVIDPTPDLEWGTYFGGSEDDYGTSIYTDSQDNIILIGLTSSGSNIASSSAYQTTIVSGPDAFIAKFDSAGSRLWATYYGGSDWESAYAICTDSHDNIIITGYTKSTSNIASTSAYQTTIGGYYDAFIVKFDSIGSRLWATYYGGSDWESGHAICTDSHDNIYIIGYTESTSNIASSSAYQTTYGGGYGDAFMAKFDSSGSRLWATYYGGEAHDYGYSICSDSQNNIIIIGFTSSASNIASTSAYQTTFGGYYDAFIAKFDSSGSRLWATYYGGSEGDRAHAICTDSHDNIIISGYTYSKSNIASSSAYQTTIVGGSDAFIAKFDSAGSRLWATYYGGNDSEDGQGICSDSYNNIILIGYTWSSSSIASSSAYQIICGGGADAFIVKFDSKGLRLWATYYGGSKSDDAIGICSDSRDNIIVSGTTSSISNIASPSAYQTTYYGGGSDAFMAKFKDTTYLPPITAINIANSNSSNSVFIYPNPAQTNLTLEHSALKAIEEVSIYNLLGEVISSQKASTEKVNLDISYLQEGIYLVKAKTIEGEISQKITIKR
jgi:electron transfer flavoprotein alpha subunit